MSDNLASQSNNENQNIHSTPATEVTADEHDDLRTLFYECAESLPQKAKFIDTLRVLNPFSSK